MHAWPILAGMRFRSTVRLAAFIILALPVSGTCGQQYSTWSAPVNLGPVVNSTANDQHPTISKDGLTLIFASDRPGGLGDFDLWVTRRNSLSDPWQAPVHVPVLNSPSREYAPNLSADGHWLFFNSNRPGGCGGEDLYAAHRRNKHDDLGWETPIHLGCVLNTAADDAGPNLFEDPATRLFHLYFTRNLTPHDPDGFDIYVSTCASDLDSCNRQGLWSAAAYLAELSSPVRDTRTAVRRRDGLEMIFTSNRPGGSGSSDLWVSTRATTHDSWSRPVNLGPPINSSAFDGAPALSWDGDTLYFYSQRPGGLGGSDLYVSTRKKLSTPRP